MPDPLIYGKALVVATATSAVMFWTVLAVWGRGRQRIHSACVASIGGGLAAGCIVLSLPGTWPPVNALDRFLTLVAPAVLAIEWIAGLNWVSRWFAWAMRLGLATLIPRTLLHGSAYLSGMDDDWVLWQVVMALVICSVLLAVVWSSLACLSHRSPGASISLSLSMATLAAGLAVTLAGYIRGGAAVLPWVAGVSVATLFITVIGRKVATQVGVEAQVGVDAPVIVAMGVVGLFGTLFIGRFFGEISTARALTMLLAPILCWVSEIPWLRNRNPWLLGSLRLVFVAIPLMTILGLAKRDFDREMAPLLAAAEASQFPAECEHREWYSPRIAVWAVNHTVAGLLDHGNLNWQEVTDACSAFAASPVVAHESTGVHRCLSCW